MITERQQPESEAWCGCATWMMCAFIAVPGAFVGGLIGFLLKTDMWGSTAVGFLLGIAVGSGVGITLCMHVFITLKDVGECAVSAAFMGGFDGLIPLALIASLNEPTSSFELSFLDVVLGVLIIILGTFFYVILEGLIYKVWQKSWQAAVPLILGGGVLLGFFTGYGFGFLADLGDSLGIPGALIGLTLAAAVSILLVYGEVVETAKQKKTSSV
ncbi:MAG: hypothetical protein ACK2UW_03530 [Anaerolineales bacterium]|jgi:F0F1-type ATP synthase assembly protein I